MLNAHMDAGTNIFSNSGFHVKKGRADVGAKRLVEQPFSVHRQDVEQGCHHGKCPTFVLVKNSDPSEHGVTSLFPNKHPTPSLHVSFVVGPTFSVMDDGVRCGPCRRSFLFLGLGLWAVSAFLGPIADGTNPACFQYLHAAAIGTRETETLF